MLSNCSRRLPYLNPKEQPRVESASFKAKNKSLSDSWPRPICPRAAGSLHHMAPTLKISKVHQPPPHMDRCFCPVCIDSERWSPQSLKGTGSAVVLITLSDFLLITAYRSFKQKKSLSLHLYLVSFHCLKCNQLMHNLKSFENYLYISSVILGQLESLLSW